ncbi:SLAM family member 9-like [Eleginops maclovinus]|uniref:SLAM family member 9-like n=1 Tax=Eleginops maclovinus TaxID=56733 RepID=UPI0030802C46
MENVLVFCLLFLASLRSASTEDMLFEEGGSVTLNLRPAPSKPITVIEWKFNGITLAEWAKDVVELTYKRANTSLDITTGRLVVQKMTKTDQGEYSVEVNNRVQAEKYQVVFIKRVPKPSVLTQPLSCSTEDEQCSLTCDGDTTEAEPVTYSWKTGAGEWKASGRSMTITKAEHGQVETFTCKMKNPVSEEESEPVTNKLHSKVPDPGPSTGIVLGIIFLILVALIGVGVFVAWKKKKLPCFPRSVSVESPPPPDAVFKPLIGSAGSAAGAEDLTQPAEEKADSKNGSAGGVVQPDTSLKDQPDSQAGSADGAEDPTSPAEEKADSQAGSADGAEDPTSPAEEKADSQAGSAEGVANQSLDAKQDNQD